MFDRLLGQIFNIFRGSPRDPEPRDKVGDDAIMIVGDARPMDNLNTPSQATGSKPELEGLLHPDRKELFHWLLLLLRLVTTIRFGFPVWKFEPKEANSVGRFHTQSYGYLDALTTLLLRRDEIVAAVEISPGSGFIMSDDKSKDAESEDSISVDSDFYDTTRSLPPGLQVTCIANPESGRLHGTDSNQIKVLDFRSKSLWGDLKKNPYHYLTITKETGQHQKGKQSAGNQKGNQEKHKVKNKYSLPRVDLEAHLETIRSYLNEYKTLPAAQQKVISRIFTTFITTSCWPKMHRRVYSWSSLSLIKQLCAIDRDTLQSLSSKLETPYVLPDVSLFKFLQTGWNSYLPRLLDHHPDVKSSSTGTAPLPQKLLDAITSKGSYLYSRDVAIDFHNLLTSSLITYVVRLDYVDRALRKLNGKIPTDPHPLELLFDGLSIAIRAVCAISHSKAMAAHMNLLSGYVRLPKDQDASDSLSFISDLIENNSMQSLEAQGVAQYLKSRGEGRKHSDQSNGQDGNSDGPSSRDGVTDDGQNSKEDNSNDCWEDDFEDDGLPTELTGTPFTPNKNDSEGSVTPEPVIIRRWIMSLVDHFASILVLERACVKLPDSGEISFSLLGVDHRTRNLPDWKKVETITRQLMLAVPTKKTDTFITQLKAYIKNYRSDGCIPGTEARLRDSVILPFQGLLKHDLDPQSQTESVTACLHCEATLMALMSYLAANSKHDLARLLQIKEHFTYKISVSKSCCPVCWAIVDIMNHLHNPKNIQFQVRARHSTLYMVDLPSFLPDSIVDQLILDFTTKLQSELLEAMNVISAGDNEPGSIRPTHKSKKENQSFESIASAITVSTEGGSVDAEYADDLQNKYDAILPKVTTEGGSVDCEAAVKEQ